MVAKEGRIALVIGAGGIRCAAALGALRVLQQAGVTPALVVGCSGGAVFASAIAMGWDAGQAISATQRFWTHDLTGRRENRALLQALAPRRQGFDGRFGLRHDGALNRGLQELLGAQSFAATQIPLLITATDFHSGEQVVLQEGLLVDAVRASMATPFVFAPWAVGERLLVEGNLSDPLPATVATREGADIVIALGFESPTQAVIDSPLRYGLQIGSILTNSIFNARLAFHGQVHHASTLLLAPRLPQRRTPFDAKQFPALVAAGEEAMRERLSDLQAMAVQALAAEAQWGAAP